MGVAGHICNTHQNAEKDQESHPDVRDEKQRDHRDGAKGEAKIAHQLEGDQLQVSSWVRL